MMNFIKDILLNIELRDILDIVIVAIIIYKIAVLIHETRAEQLMKGIVILLVATFFSTLLQLNTLSYILQQTMTVGLIAIIIVFQPELRRALEYLGRSKFLRGPTGAEIKSKEHQIVDAISLSCEYLAARKIGALIIVERETGLNEHVGTGIRLDAAVSKELLINTFIPNTPLHDGAVIIEGPRIIAAACILPLSDNLNISKELGTRHRAGLGVSETCDCLSIIVSEETGAISLAEFGVLKRRVQQAELKAKLHEIYAPKIKTNKLMKWRQKNAKENKKDIDA